MSSFTGPGFPDLRARVLGGLGWVVGSQVGLQVTRALAAIAVARLLTPGRVRAGRPGARVRQPGAGVLRPRAGRGADPAQEAVRGGQEHGLLGHRGLQRDLRRARASRSSGPLAALYGDADAQPLLAVLSITFVISALGAPQQSLMLRDMDFRRVEVLPMVGAIVGGAVGVALAATRSRRLGDHPAVRGHHRRDHRCWCGCARPGGPASPSRWPACAISAASASTCSATGCSITSRPTGTASSSAASWAPRALGAYAIAYNTILQPASKLGGPLQRVMSPAFCRIQDEPERIAAAWARVTRVLASLCVPALIGLVVVAPDFVPVVLGNQWAAAVPVIQILAWVGIVQALQSLSVDVLMARDRDPHDLPLHRRPLRVSPRGLRGRPAVGRGRRGRCVRGLDHAGRALPERARRSFAGRLTADLVPQPVRGLPGSARDGRDRAGHAPRPGRRRHAGAGAPSALHRRGGAHLRGLCAWRVPELARRDPDASAPGRGPPLRLGRPATAEG